MKNKKKKIMVISCIMVAIIFVLVLLLINNKTSLSDEKKLLLDCSKTFTYDNHNQIFEIELYSVGNNKSLIQKLIMEPNYEIDADLSESILYQLEDKVKGQIEMLTQNNKFIDYEVYREENKFISEISYTINDKNNEEMIETLEYDYLNNSIDDIILNIEKGGMKCLKQ